MAFISRQAFNKMRMLRIPERRLYSITQVCSNQNIQQCGKGNDAAKKLHIGCFYLTFQSVKTGEKDRGLSKQVNSWSSGKPMNILS